MFWFAGLPGMLVAGLCWFFAWFEELHRICKQPLEKIQQKTICLLLNKKVSVYNE